MVFSGKIYTAVEMHEMCVVDVLAEDGMGSRPSMISSVERALLRLPPRRLCGAPGRQVTRAELDRIVEMGGRRPLPGVDRSRIMGS
jgi:hypothetical protein